MAVELVVGCMVALAALVAIDWLVRAYAAAMRELRREAIAEELKALSYSTRHRPILPLLAGFTEELAVNSLEYELIGNQVVVRFELAWWARPRCLYFARLTPKVERLLTMGGIHVEDEGDR